MRAVRQAGAEVRVATTIDYSSESARARYLLLDGLDELALTRFGLATPRPRSSPEGLVP